MAGPLTVGQPLPTEARMAEEFGVSRPLLREALAELRAEGFVETVSGRGTFVRHPSESDLADAFAHQLLLSGGPGPPPTTSTRPGRPSSWCRPSWPPSAPRGLHRDAGAAAASMKESREDAAAYTAADVGFHVEVARATLNPLLPTLLAPMATMIVEGRLREPQPSDAVRIGIAGDTAGAARDQARGSGRSPPGHGRPPARVPARFPRARHGAAAQADAARLCPADLTSAVRAVHVFSRAPCTVFVAAASQSDSYQVA